MPPPVPPKPNGVPIIDSPMQTTITSNPPGVNFINILRMKFLYERRFGSFSYVHVTREKLPKQHWYEKFVCKMLMKLTTVVPPKPAARRALSTLALKTTNEMSLYRETNDFELDPYSPEPRHRFPHRTVGRRQPPASQNHLRQSCIDLVSIL